MTNMQCKCGSRKFSLRLAEKQRNFQGIIEAVCWVCGEVFKTLIDEFPLGGTKQ